MRSSNAALSRSLSVSLLSFNAIGKHLVFSYLFRSTVQGDSGQPNRVKTNALNTMTTTMTGEQQREGVTKHSSPQRKPQTTIY